MRVRPILTPGAIALLCLIVGAPASADKPKPVDLSWRVPTHTYLLYKSVRAEQLAHKRKIAAPDQEAGVPNEYMHFFGYHVAPDGVLKADAEPETLGELLFQLVLTTSGKADKPGAKWEHAWQSFLCDGMALKSSYEFKSIETFEGIDCALIQGHHVLTPNPKRPNSFQEFTADSTAYFDPAGGRLRGASLEVHGVRNWFKEQQIADWVLAWHFTCDFDSADDPVLKQHVENAITAGVERLMAVQDNDGLWIYYDHRRGGTALCLLAVLTCGIAPTDPRIVKCFESLEKEKPEDTYAVGISLLAYEAKYISDDERRAFLEGRKIKEFKRDISEHDKKEMQKLVRWIIDNQNVPNPLWNYWRGSQGRQERFDLSNSQYALLGLCAAQRCGLDIPAGPVHKFADALRDLQEVSGPDIKRIIGADPPKPPKAGKTAVAGAPERHFTRSSRSVQARGWAYAQKADKDNPGYGSMTSSGITGMTICLEIVQNLSPRAAATEFGNGLAKWLDSCRASVESGLAWHEVHYSVIHNAEHGDEWYYYYLYGIERVGMLCDVRLFGEHDWYDEGAAALVCLQGKDGFWPDGGTSTVETSFALLFLKRGTVPLLKRPVITEGPGGK